MTLRTTLALLAAVLVPALASAQDDPGPRLRASIDGAPVRGAADPLVTIVEFSDFQCPFCGRVQPTLSRILEAHPGDVRIVFRHNPLPFHDRAMAAAELAMEARAQLGDTGFWAVHDRLFQQAPQGLSRAALEQIAREAGLDAGGVRRALDDGPHRPQIEADQRMATDLGARGTPTFFLNGHKLVGAQGFEAFEQAVQRELGEARALVRRGVRRSAVYGRLMASALATAPAPAAAPTPSPPAVPEGAVRVPTNGAPQQGPDDALVTIVVFSDFQCPFCSRLEPTLSALRERYGVDLRVVWKNNPLPFHTNAMPAAEAAAEAFAQGRHAKFWQMHDLLMRNQQALGRDDLVGYAQQIGLNVDRFRQALDGHVHQPAIQADMALAAQLGANGTPTSFVNGRRLTGAQPIESFVSLVDTELVAARARVARGTPRSRIYATLPVGPAPQAAAFVPTPLGVPPNPPGAPEPRVRIAVPADAPALGRRNARVTIQVFGDFQCPYSARLRSTLAELLDRYPNDVRVVWRHLPLEIHPMAGHAAEVAVEARRQGGDALFWDVLDRIYDHQTELSDERLREIAREAGVDAAGLEAALSSGRHRARVQADVDAVTRADGANGTPTSYVNGRKIVGAQPLDAFVRAVDEALAERGPRRRVRPRH